MSDQPPRFRVVIAGGGVAALEAALALRDLAGERVDLQLLAPAEEFRYRPMTVAEPFAYAPARRYPLAELAGDIGVELVADAFARVDVEHRIAHTEAGTELPYDALLLALGARPRAPFTHGLTIDDAHMDDLLHGIVQDVEGGYVRSVAFVAPERMGWPLPIYELALMLAARAYGMNMEVAVTVVTPESAPLAIFGAAASDAVATLLADAGIATIAGASAQVPADGRVVVQPGDRTLEADRVIVLPELFGPAVRGLPAGEHGFIPTDPHGRVRGAPGVFAAGDATDFPVKQGGLAAQQADAAAESIAALAGAAVTPTAPRPTVHAMLLTGAKPIYLTAQISGEHGFDSQVADAPTWPIGAKIAARYLAPYLAGRDQAG